MRLLNLNSYIYINIYDARWNNSKLNIIRLLIKIYGPYKKGLTINLSNDKEIKKINFRWRGINKTTNILSFPNYDKNVEGENMKYIGDIIITYDTIKLEAYNGGLTFNDHMSHILLHGILHLEGYKHYKKTDEVTMQKQEIKYLKKLNINNPYQDRYKVN